MATGHLKSILKDAPHASSRQTKEERDREVALYHANLIQDRKNIELEIVLNTEQLIDLPTSPSSTSDHPSAEDVATFKSLLRPFQPSDYDALIQERNINERCGYTLCPNPRVKSGGKGDYRLISKSGKAKDFKIIPREETERWCSDICARRALYVKVQLNETPAWERIAVTVDIELMDEVKTDAERNEEQLAEDINKLDLGSSSGGFDAQFPSKASSRANDLAGISIKEKETIKPAKAPALDTDELNDQLASTHLSLEGYRPTFKSHRQRLHQTSQDSDEDDSMDDRTEDGRD